MLFNSADYFLFLGLVLLAFWSLRRFASPRLFVLLAASCAFYMAWQPLYLGLILFSATVDYVAGRAIAGSTRPRVRRLWLGGSLVANLGLLWIFKYFNFFVESLGETVALGARTFGTAAPHASFFSSVHLDVLLPVGISFYTFQTLSYTIDVYRGTRAPSTSPLKFAVFVMFFPQLVAGPIVRADEFLPQLDTRPRLSVERVSEGFGLIALGLLKKVVVADFLSVNLVDRVFDDPGRYSGAEVVVALYAFTMQIYCDFSGYTDIARGSAGLLGFTLPENFDRPYAAPNPAEFWRRWHMTLSRWLRDYLYFPLGGSRVAPVRAYANLFLTMFIIGIWHGAAWTFVIYALMQATAMVLHRLWHRHVRGGVTGLDPAGLLVCKIFLNLQFVVFSRIFFRASGIDNAIEILSRIVSGTSSLAQVTASVWMVLIGSFALHYVPRTISLSLRGWFGRLPGWGQAAVMLSVFAFAGKVATSEVVPYIYFQF